MGAALDPGEGPVAAQFCLDFRYIEKNITWLPPLPSPRLSQDKFPNRGAGESRKLGAGPVWDNCGWNCDDRVFDDSRRPA